MRRAGPLCSPRRTRRSPARAARGETPWPAPGQCWLPPGPWAPSRRGGAPRGRRRGRVAPARPASRASATGCSGAGAWARRRRVPPARGPRRAGARRSRRWPWRATARGPPRPAARAAPARLPRRCGEPSTPEGPWRAAWRPAAQGWPRTVAGRRPGGPPRATRRGCVCVCAGASARR